AVFGNVNNRTESNGAFHFWSLLLLGFPSDLIPIVHVAHRLGAPLASIGHPGRWYAPPRDFKPDHSSVASSMRDSSASHSRHLGGSTGQRYPSRSSNGPPG